MLGPRWTTRAAACALATAVLAGCGGEPGERDFRNGVREIERGNYVRGRALLEKSINRRPGSDANADAYAYLGLASWKLGQVERSIGEFQESRRLNPGRAEPSYNLGVLMFESGDVPAASSFFQEAAKLDPADPRPLEYLATIHIRASEWQEARRALFSALSRAPQSPRVLAALASIDSATGNPDKAIFYLMQALEKNPNYAPALFNLGLLYAREMKDNEQAAAYYRRYLEVAGDDPHAAYAREALRDLAAPAAPAAVAAPAPAKPPAPTPPAPSQEKPPPAIARPEPVPAPLAPVAPPAEPKPEPVTPQVRTVEDGLAEARELSQKGEGQKALEICMNAAGRAERAGDPETQEKILREAVKLCYDQGRAHFALGRFLAGRGFHDAASRSFKQAVILDPKLAAAHLGLAESAAKTGETDAALVAIKQAVQLEPENPDARWMLARLYDEDLELPERAAQAYGEFAKMFPGDARVVKAQERIRALAPPPPAVEEPEPPPPPPPPKPKIAEQPKPAPPPAREAVALPSATLRAPARRLSVRKPLFRNTQAAVQAYNRGTLYQQQEDWERAIYFYTRAVENDDGFATAFFNLGSVYWAKRDLDLAADAYIRALQIQPDMVAARYNLALIYRDTQRRADAVAQLEELVRSRPDYAPAHYVLGMLYAEDPASVGLAKERYREFLKLAPNDSSAPVVREWVATH